MKITAIGDLHYVQDRTYDTNEQLPAKFTAARDRYFNAYLKEVFSLESDYFVSIGDLTNYGTEKELTEVYNIIHQYGKPFIHAIGNHDLYSMTREEVCAITKQKVNHTIELQHVKLIFWETARVMDYDVYGGTVTQQQLDWLQEELQAAGDKLVILFGHHPIYNTTYHSNYENLSIDPAIDVYETLQKKVEGKAIYVCGHNHFDSIVEQDNWTFVQIASVLDVPAVRVIEVEENEVKIYAQTILDESYAEDAAYIGTEMNHFNPIWDSKGTPLARNKVIKLREVIITNV